MKQITRSPIESYHAGRKVWISIAILLFLWLLHNFWLKPTEQVHYLTERVQRRNLVKVVNATGEVGAKQLVNVGAQVSGQIEKLYVELGAQVHKGDLIAQIDSTTQVNELNINKAKLQSYQAQLQSAKIALKTTKSQYLRAKRLYQSKAISKAALEDIENSYAAAQSKITELNSLIQQAQISVNNAKVNLGYTKITAPLEGTIVSVPVKEGQTVTAAQVIPTIVQIADLSHMEILMQISEGDVTKIKPGMKVQYTVLSESDQVYETTLQSIDPGLTTLTNGNYSGVVDSDAAIYYYGRLIVPNTDGKLHIGMTTQNIITIESAEHVLTIPAMAIQERAGHQYVQVLTPEGKVEERKVELGISDNISAEVISGLLEGEEVITARMTGTELSESVKNNRFGRR